ALSRVALTMAVTGHAPAAVASLASGVAPTRWAWRLIAPAVAGTAILGGLIGLAGRGSPSSTGEPKRAEGVDTAAPVRLDHGSGALAVAIARSGQIATAGTGPEVRVWNPEGKPATRYEVPQGAAAIAFAPEGRLLAAAGFDGMVRLWDTASGELRHTLPGHGDS